MLQFIRGAVGTWIVKILFVVLIVSFAVWGIGDIFRGHGPASTVAEIGPIKVPAADLDREFRQQINRLRPMFGGQLDMEQAKQLGLVEQTLDQIIQRSLLDLAAQQSGLLVGDDLVRLKLQQIPGSRNEQGQFDPELLRRALASNSLTESTFVGMVRDGARRELVMGAVTAGARPPEPLVDALYRYRQERRTAETLTLSNDRMPDPATPDDADLTRYHEDKAVRFTAPEYRTLTVAQISVDDYAKTIELSEDEIKAAYDARADEFQSSERRSFQQVLVDTEDKARKIAEAARAAKGDLASAAKAEGVEVSELGPSAEPEVPEIGASVFAIDQDVIPDPFKSDLGWHVIKVTKIEPAQIRKLADVRDEVVTQLGKDRAADALPTLINRVKDSMAGGATLEEAAAKFKLKLVKIDSVDATGAKPDGGKVADVPDLVSVLQAAFNLSPGSRSPVSDGPDHNSVFVVRVDGLTPSHLRPLAEVRDQVAAGWKADRRAEEAVAKADEIVGLLKAGGTLEAVAKATGAVAAVTEPVLRTPDHDAKLPADLLKALFAQAPGGVVKAATADGQVVARVKDIIPADAVGAGAPLRDALRKSQADDLLEQFSDGLRAQYPVRVDRDRVQALFNSN